MGTSGLLGGELRAKLRQLRLGVSDRGGDGGVDPGLGGGGGGCRAGGGGCCFVGAQRQGRSAGPDFFCF